MDQVTTNLDVVLDNPQPILVSINGQQIVAVLQDVVAPPDILLQALRAADVTLTPLTESCDSPSDSEEEGAWASAADRILRWLDDHPQPDEPPSEDDHGQQDDDDSRRPLLSDLLVWQPVRPSVPQPQVDWDKISHTFNFYPPSDSSSLRIPCKARSVVNNRPPKPEQLSVLKDAVHCMCASGLIQLH